MSELFMFGLFVVFLIFVGKVGCSVARNKEDRTARKTEKQKEKFKKDFWDRLKDKQVAFITKDGKQVFANVWEASDAIGIDASTIWFRANNERHYTYEPKDSFEPVKHKFYWVNK